MLPTCITTCSIQTLAQEVVSPAEKEQDDGGRLGCGDACIPPAAAASGVRHRGSNSSIFHVSHDIFDGAHA